jgi:REP element-mobilizing transposase RayT
LSVTTTTVDGARFFTNFHAACVVAKCFADASLHGDATLLAWVLMPDHVHWLIQLGEQQKLESLVNRLKSISARKANAWLGRQGALWDSLWASTMVSVRSRW